MLVPLRELFRSATLEWNATTKCIRLLKWVEALAAVSAANVLTTYLTAARIEARLERELRAIATPTFGTYVSILRISAELRESLRDASFMPLIVADYPRAGNEGLIQAVEVLRKQYSLGDSPSRGNTAIELFDVLLGVRNRGVGHGGIPETEEVSLIETICQTLSSACNRLPKPQILVVNDVRADTERVGDFAVRGILFGDDSEGLWEERRSYEDILSLKKTYFFDGGGNPQPAPPFLQTEGRSFWFLQKYRRGGKSPFSDFRSAQSKTDSYWDEDLRDFFEERFEQGNKAPIQISPTGVYHDLPPENEAYTKFVGRTKDLQDLHANLRPERRTHILALGGVGGVGKTALARAFSQSVADSPGDQRDFDYIVWVSAKTTILKETVEQLNPGFEDIEDVLDEIARVADSPELIYVKPFDRKKEEILGLLAGGRFLLVIDNFETVKRKEKFWGFLLDVRAPSKVLVTSREIFSEGCLTFQVTELDEDDALQVFANECKALGEDPALLIRSKKERSELVARTGGVPLALKHIAILLHRGGLILDALQKLSAKVGPIAEFCFSETFRVLGKGEKTVWVAFGIFQRPAAVGELVQITELPESEVQQILNTLKQYSIVSRSVDGEGFETFSCLPLTLEFAKKAAERWAGATEMAHRFKQYRAVIAGAGILDGRSEAARIARTSGVVHPKLLARELSRKAIAIYREGRKDKALELIVTAEKIDIRQPSVWEARGQIELEEGEYHGAFDSYTKLLDLTPFDLTVIRQLVYLCKLLEEWDLEIEYGRRVVNLPGSTRKDWHVLGMAYYKKAKWEKDRGNNDRKQAALLNAVECFRSALIPNPNSSQDRHHNKYACHSLALTFMHLRRLGEAEETVVKGLEWVPYDATLLELQHSLLSRPRRS